MYKKSCLLLLIFLCLNIAEAGSLKIIRRNLDLPGWQEAHRGLKIMYITDLHLREEVMKDPLFTEDLPAAIREEQPHLLLIGGDLFQYRADDYSPIKQEFSKLLDSLPHIPLGIYMVLGNHEEQRAGAALAALKNTKIKVLRDSAVHLHFRGKKLHVWGLKDNKSKKEYIRKNTLQKLLQIKTPAILLAHRPAAYPQIPSDTPLLILTGHTHGGVVHLPGFPRGALTRLMKHGHTGDYIYGWSEDGRKKMYVSCGMGGKGYSGLRFNNPPEALILTFQKMKKTADQ